MRYEIKKELLEYFKAIPDRTAQENRLCLHLQNDIESFDITGVCRDDIDGIGYDGANMTDAQMDRLATKMEDSYIDNGFWVDMKCHLEDMGIPKLNNPNEENNEQA